MLKKEHVLRMAKPRVSPRLDLFTTIRYGEMGEDYTGYGDSFKGSYCIPGVPYWETGTGIAYLKELYSMGYPDGSGAEASVSLSAPAPYDIRVKDERNYFYVDISKGRDNGMNLNGLIISVGAAHVTFDPPPRRLYLKKSSRYLLALLRRVW